MKFVSFELSGRTGNNIFQYLISKVIQIKFGHTYVPIQEFKDRISAQEKRKFIMVFGNQESEDNSVLTINEVEMKDAIDGKITDIENKNVICNGYFQKSEFYLPYRNELINILKSSHDYWISNGKQIFVRDFMNCGHNQLIGENDIVMSLRLDDFIQRPSKTSDIIPPEYYLNILEEEMQYRDKLFIVSDIFRYDWEKKYVEFFAKWDPIFIQQDVMSDFAVLRDCHRLIHSNSTFCWIASFLSDKKKRYIPNTHFYCQQLLKEIGPGLSDDLRSSTKLVVGGVNATRPNDELIDVNPLPHQDVYNLNVKTYLKAQVVPLPYAIPDECIVDSANISDKDTLISPMVPGQRSTYMFGPGQESEYLNHYDKCCFVNTRKKGGWDCLRHYEILARGSIPLFEGLEYCPAMTMTTFPKQIVMDATRELFPFVPEKAGIYHEYVNTLLKHTRENCSTSACAKYFLSKIWKPVKNVLLITGHPGPNYTRELFWIGMKRYLQSIGGFAVEYPKIDYLYKGFPEEKKEGLHGNGFIYTGRLDDDFSPTEEVIIEKLQNKFFDIVVYGKVGPDEFETGSIPNFPLWEHVFKRYKKDEIICLYGGDECIDLRNDNRYSEHLYHTAQYATCFVRELDI